MPYGSRRPFSELFEVAAQELVREAASGVEAKYMGFTNQVYMNDLVNMLPERYIRKKGYITTAAYYSTGTVTVGTGTANVIGSLTSWTSANSNDFNLYVDGYNRIYRVTYAAGTSLTFQDNLTWVESSTTGATYRLVQNRYAVASDFSYVVSDDPDNPNAVSFMVGGFEMYMPPMSNDKYNQNYNSSISTVFSGYTIENNTSGTTYLKIWMNPQSPNIIGYWYVPVLTALTETTVGTVTFAASTAVIGVSTLFTNINTANTYYIRNDADGTGSASVWAPVSSVANATALTLSATFTGTTGTGQNYTISEASKWPSRFDDAILYRVAMLVDPDNLNYQKWSAMWTDAVGSDKATEAKRNREETLKSFPGMKRYRRR